MFRVFRQLFMATLLFPIFGGLGVVGDEGGSGGGLDIPDAGGDPGGGEPSPGGDGGTGEGNTPPQEHWTDSIEAFKGNEQLKEFETPEAALEAMKALKEKVAGMGTVPDSPEGYAVTVPDVWKDQADGVTAFVQQAAAKAGVSNEAAQKMLDDYAAYEQQNIRQAFAVRDEALDSISGGKREDFLNAANETLHELDERLGFGGRLVHAVDRNPAMKATTEFIEMLHGIRRAISPDAFDFSGPGANRKGGTAMDSEDFLGAVLDEQQTGGKR